MYTPFLHVSRLSKLDSSVAMLVGPISNFKDPHSFLFCFLTCYLKDYSVPHLKMPPEQLQADIKRTFKLIFLSHEMKRTLTSSLTNASRESNNTLELGSNEVQNLNIFYYNF